jgi:16S rRNA C1402 (ribose-2'-O) methylase RsmI
MFEKVERGTLSALLESVTRSKLRGEYIIVIAGVGKEEQKTSKIKQAMSPA